MDKELKASLQREEVFQDEKGVYSPQKVERFLQARGMKEKAFLEEQRRSMRRTQILKALQRVVRAPLMLSQMRTNVPRQKRLGAAYKVSPSVVALTAPKDAELKAFFEKNYILIYNLQLLYLLLKYLYLRNLNNVQWRLWVTLNSV